MENINEHLDSDLVDKNVLGAMVLDNISQNYPGIKQFFSTIKLIEVNDKQATFIVSDVMTSEWINNHYMHILEKVFWEESEEELGFKKVVVNSQDAYKSRNLKPKKKTSNSRGLTRVHEGTLNGRQSFNTFVKGASNTLAAIAAERVADKPGK